MSKAWQRPTPGSKVLIEGIVWPVPKEGDEGWIIYPIMREFMNSPEGAVEDLLIDLDIDSGGVKPHIPIGRDSEACLKRALRRARHRRITHQDGWEYFYCEVWFREYNFESWVYDSLVRNQVAPLAEGGAR